MFLCVTFLNQIHSREYFTAGQFHGQFFKALLAVDLIEPLEVS